MLDSAFNFKDSSSELTLRKNSAIRIAEAEGEMPPVTCLI